MLNVETGRRPDAGADTGPGPGVQSDSTGGESPQQSAQSPWPGWQAVVMLTLGAVIPTITLTICAVWHFEPIWRMVLRHPLEMLIECAFVLLVPAANCLAWSAVFGRFSWHPVRMGILNGAAIGTAFAAALVLTAAVLLGYPTLDGAGGNHINGFESLALVSGSACLSAILMANRLRIANRTRSARMRSVMYSTFGALLALVAVAGAEARSTCLRLAELSATSDSREERAAGLKRLRDLNPEKDLRMDCADPRTAGIPGLFLRLDRDTQSQLYFAATGKPYRDTNVADLSLQSDDYLRRHVVGAAISGLSLIRSGISGSVSAESLSSSLAWTFVFKNKTYEPQEMRAEIALPPGAVISGMTLWVDGEPKEAASVATGNVPGVQNWTTLDHHAPALITDLGRGRVLLHCYPVPTQGEMKVRLAITAPLKMDGLCEAWLSLPRFIDTNFAVSGQHSLRLRSREALSLKHKAIQLARSPAGDLLLSGSLDDADLAGSGLSVRAERQATLGPLAIRDRNSNGESYIVQSIKQVPAFVPSHLVVVLDGSQSVKEHLKEISQALSRIPRNVPASLLVASEEEDGLLEPTSLEQGLKNVSKMSFAGGHDNLQAIVKAAELAGDSERGAVLWIHGPQPSLNQEMYIMAPYTRTPVFYDLAMDNGSTDLNEYFKNHKEIGPFIPVARNAPPGEDLGRLVSRWNPGSKDFIIEFTRTAKKPSCSLATEQQAAELACLCADYECTQLIARRDPRKAAEIAVACKLVTPVSSALVRVPYSGYVGFGESQGFPWLNNVQTQAPVSNQTDESSIIPLLQGASNETIGPQVDGVMTVPGQQWRVAQTATNGTIGPMGGDATVVSGVNTAANVRVNSMANLEALLNMLANLGEIAGVALGVINLVLGCMNRGLDLSFLDCRLTVGPRLRIFLGVALAVAGMLVPGCIGWLFDSARDANCFS